MKNPREVDLLIDSALRELDFGKIHREYRFDEGRRWRFDFAAPKIFLAVEIEGGRHSFQTKAGHLVIGHHHHEKGFESDCEKYNTAILLGWKVLRFTTKMVLDGRARSAIRRWAEANA